MGKKYNTKFSFEEMTPTKAYILGLMWADGWITSTKTECALSSNDEEIVDIANIIYPNQNRTIENRKDSSCRILHIYNIRLISELEKWGFTPTKSIDGIPIIPNGFEQYYLLGLLDGDGCIYHKNGKNLRVFYCGNKNTMKITMKLIKKHIGVDMILSKPSEKEDIYLENRKLNNNKICYKLQSKGVSDSIKILEYLYSNIKDIPYLKRKYKKYQECLIIRNKMNKCILCNSTIVRTSATHKYCDECKDLIRRLKNRQQDEYKKFGFKMELEFLLLPHDKKDINLLELADISSKSL